MQIYTDASCKGLEFAYTLIVLENSKDSEPKVLETLSYNGTLEKYEDNNYAELYGIYKAVEYIEAYCVKNNLKNLGFSVFTDSLSSMYTYKHCVIGNKNLKKSSKQMDNLIDDFKSLVNRLNSINIHIKLRKVKGHDENLYNNECDRLAKEKLGIYGG